MLRESALFTLSSPLQSSRQGPLPAPFLFSLSRLNSDHTFPPFFSFCVSCKGPVELRVLADHLASRSRQIYITPQTAAAQAGVEEADDPDAAFHLASYIDAVARVVCALPGMDEELLATLEQLVLLLLDSFPRLYKSQRYAARTSLVRCCASLYLKGAVLAPFFGRIAYQGIIKACSRGIEHDAAVATARAQAAAAAGATAEAVNAAGRNNANGGSATTVDDTTTDRGLLPVYIDFFRTLVSDKQLSYVPTEELPAEMLPLLQRTLYDETLRALLAILAKLDLGSISAEDAAAVAAATGVDNADEPELHANPVLALRLRVPLDFVVLTQLVEFATAWLRGAPNQLFTRWTYSYVTQIVALATKSPFVSGFYKLLQVRGHESRSRGGV